MNYLQLETRIMHYRNLSKQIFNRQRKTPTVIFLCKIIYNNYFIVKLIKKHSLIFTWIIGSTYEKWKFSYANFNSSIKIGMTEFSFFSLEKLSTKNLLLSLEKKRNPIFSIKLGQRLPKSFFQLHVKNSRFFLSDFLKKRRLTQGKRRLKAADSPLLLQSFPG